MEACPNRLFVARKPMFVGSNAFLSRLKRRYGVRKAGFSGTLDPFACGTLVIAFGQYTRLFRFLAKSPKTYRATLWLGAESPTLDIEGITALHDVSRLPEAKVQKTVESFVGDFTYPPPAFSAKKVAGKRAYDLARRGEEVALGPVTSRIHAIRPLHYRHPFITFEATVSEGTYIRSLAEAIAKALGVPGALSYLERTREGRFVYRHEEALDPLDFLDAAPNRYLGDPADLEMGRKLSARNLQNPEPGRYTLVFGPFFAIIEITKSQEVRYLLNKVKRCSF
ncbi:tRNA pseudouridine(55) synthase TruB [Hydrogenimonas sp.]